MKNYDGIGYTLVLVPVLSRKCHIVLSIIFFFFFKKTTGKDCSCKLLLDVEVERQPAAPCGSACLNPQNSTGTRGKSQGQDPDQLSYEFDIQYRVAQMFTTDTSLSVCRQLIL